MGRGQRKRGKVKQVERTGAVRDYDALWERHFARAQRAGMSSHMAKYVANREVKEIQLADRGLTPIGSGDLELLY